MRLFFTEKIFVKFQSFFLDITDKLSYSSHNLNIVFVLFCLPIVGIVVTISPSLSLYNMVVLPAASRPTIRILISFLPNRPLNKLPNILPISFYCFLLESLSLFVLIYSLSKKTT